MELQTSETSDNSAKSSGGGCLAATLVLAGVLAFLFFPSFLPGRALYATDTPLSFLNSQARRLPAGFTGEWADLNSLGWWDGSPPPDITSALHWLLGPAGFARFEAPLSLLLLGLCAWYFFRQLRLAPQACLLGALAAMLNSGFFCVACWGVAGHALTVAMSFLALALLVDTSPRRQWLRVPLAGMAVGMGVMEGADIGALFSLFVAVFIFYRAWAEHRLGLKMLAMGALRTAGVALVAGLIAAQALFVLIGTQIQGVTITRPANQSAAQRWDWATQWSLPKTETLSLLVPGLFGYRMDAEGGAAYWGAMGRSPALDRYFASDMSGPRPRGMLRYVGGTFYAGVLVVSLALWAMLQALRKERGKFSAAERAHIWFWSGTFLFTLLLAWGRFAPFYQLFYKLPYAETIRSPVKFVHVLDWSLVILFAYGVDHLWRTRMQSAAGPASARWSALKSWFAEAESFDQRWLKCSLIALELSLLAWVAYVLCRHRLEIWLAFTGFSKAEAGAVSHFTVRQAGWFILLLAVTLGLVGMVLSGRFSGHRRRAGGLLLASLLVLDLSRADRPWVFYWDYPAKIASNPVIDSLRDKPYEHRVVAWLAPLSSEVEILYQLYCLEWIQHHFPYYNIQTLDIFQLTRKPVDLATFEQASDQHFARRWQLTNTRYLLGAAAQLDDINQTLDPDARRFHILTRFDILLRPGITAATRCEDLMVATNSEGRFALIEFTGALPRVKLYDQWQVSTNNQQALDHILAPSFDPEKTVLVGSQLPAAPAVPGANPQSGSVAFVSYAPKHLVFQAEARNPSVLLLNDRFDPSWKVVVDGRAQDLLCCNYLMRGVFLQPGSHRVEFLFRPPTGWLWVNLAVLAVGAMLAALWVIQTRKSP
jgi:hypothetical protein